MSLRTAESRTDVNQASEPIASGPLCSKCRSSYFAFESAISHFQQYKGRNYGFRELNRTFNKPSDNVPNRPLDRSEEEWWGQLIDFFSGDDVSKED
jgi:hypothetical protein